jgi:4-hydroxybenzoate polyprenyltransferase
LKFSELIKLLRPHQYIKNLFIFLPLFFALKITDTGLLLNAALAFVAFSLIASGIYVLNDYHDIEEDGQHPKKKSRPLASGAIIKPLTKQSNIMLKNGIIRVWKNETQEN